MGEVLAELQARELQHVNRWSRVGLPHTEVKAETSPHVTVTRARYSRGAGTVFMIKFEGTCIWAHGQHYTAKSEIAKGRTKIYPANRIDNEVAYWVSLRFKSS